MIAALLLGHGACGAVDVRCAMIFFSVGAVALLGFAAGERAQPFRAARTASLLAAQPPSAFVQEAIFEPPAKLSATPANKRSKATARPHPLVAMVGEGGVARGIVVDDRGAPIRVATIRGMSFRPHRGRRPSYNVRGFARGGLFVFRYRWSPWHPPIPPGARMRLRTAPRISYSVIADGYVHAKIQLDAEICLALYRGESVEGLRLVLQRAATIEGQLLDRNGEPVPGVVVGVVDDPLARESEYRTRGKSDAEGRFRLDGIDPRRALWLHAMRVDMILRPHPIGALHANCTTHLPALTLEPVGKVDVRVEIVPANPRLRVSIDYGKRRSVGRDDFRVVLKPGAHQLRVLNARDEVLKKFRFWIDPHQREHYELVLLDES